MRFWSTFAGGYIDSVADAKGDPRITREAEL